MNKIKTIKLLILLLLVPYLASAQYTGGSGDGSAVENIGSPSNPEPLPIVLISFTTSCIEGTMNLKWSTASEINNHFFTIEQSFDGLNFDSVGTVEGAGNSFQILHYSISDTKANKGVSYYRLKQTDFDGKYEYSNIISAVCNNDLLKKIKMYPNPITNELTLETEEYEGIIDFEIINSIGAVVYKSSFSQNITIQTSEFTKGLYLIKFESDTLIEIKRVIKQ